MTEEVKEQPVEAVEAVAEKPADKGARRDKKGDRPQRRERSAKKEDDGIDKRLVHVRRVAKTVKGGRRMRFSALVVVGDGKGNVGAGLGSANEVPNAIDKATVVAKKNMKKISIVESTIPHEISGKFGATTIFMAPAEEGHGIVAGGAARQVFEVAGIKNIVTKIHGSTNRINVVYATLNGLLALKTREEIAARRGKKPEEI